MAFAADDPGFHLSRALHFAGEQQEEVNRTEQWQPEQEQLFARAWVRQSTSRRYKVCVCVCEC